MSIAVTAMALESPSDPRGLMPITVELNEPRADQVIIRVSRAGVAFGDIMRQSDSLIASRHWPWVPGYDVAGRIVSLGPKVKNLAVGQRVSAWTGSGGYSRFVRVPSSLVMKLPDNLSDEDAVCLNLNYVTAHQMLFRSAGLKRGAKILIHGAAGGVGTALLQAAGHAGITVYGRVSLKKASQVSLLGGIPLTDETGDFVEQIKAMEPEGLDAVFDPISFENASRSKILLKRRGTLVCYGFLEMLGDAALRNPFRFLGKMVGLMLGNHRRTKIFAINPTKKTRWYRDDLAAVLRLAADGVYKPVIDSVHLLEEANEAQERLTTRQSVGKVLLSCEK